MQGFEITDIVGEITLGDYIAQSGGRLECAKALAVMLPALDELERLYREGAPRFCFSPDDILISARGVRFAESADPRSSIKDGYAPLEAYSKRGHLDARASVYCASACLYRALTGNTPPDARERAQQDYLLSFYTRGTALPAGVGEAIMRALCVDADERYVSADEFKRALTAYSQPQTSEQTSARNAPRRVVLRSSSVSLEPDVENASCEVYVPPKRDRAEAERKRSNKQDRTRNIIMAVCVIFSLFLLVAGFLRIMSRSQKQQSSSEPQSSQSAQQE